MLLPRSCFKYAIFVAVGFVAVWGLIVLFEDSLIFFPSTYPAGFWDTEAVSRGSGVDIEDCFFDTDDGLRLHGWWARPVADRDSRDQPVVLFFHGNAGNLSDRAGFVADLCGLEVEVLIVDYRGYGRSEGRPSEQGLYRDAEAAWRFLTVENEVPDDRIVLLGKSLGGVAAVDLSTRIHPAGLILQSCFTSVPDMATRYYPFVPRFIVRTRMDNLDKIGRVSCPVLVVHSTGDEIAPFDMGRRLFDAAEEPKSFFEIQGAGHNETIAVGGRQYLEALGGFVHEVVANETSTVD